MVALEPGSGMSHSSPENIEFGPHEVDETCRIALLIFQQYVPSSVNPSDYDSHTI